MPKLETDRTVFVQVRVAPWQREICDQAAAEASMTLSGWMREVLCAAAGGPLPRQLARATRKARELRAAAGEPSVSEPIDVSTKGIPASERGVFSEPLPEQASERPEPAQQQPPIVRRRKFSR